MDEYKMPEEVEVSVRVAKLETRTKVLMPLVVLMVIALALMAVLLTVQTIARNEMAATIEQLQTEIAEAEDVSSHLARLEDRITSIGKATDSAIEATGTLNKKCTKLGEDFTGYMAEVDNCFDKLSDALVSQQNLIESQWNVIEIILDYLDLG